MFAGTSILCLYLGAWDSVWLDYQFYGFVPVRSLILAVVFVAFAGILGVASWTNLSGRPSGRDWGIAASVLYVLVSLCSAFYMRRPLRNVTWVTLAIGIVGVVGFSTWHEPDDPVADRAGRRLPGDGTNAWTEVAVWTLMGAVLGGILVWWGPWVGARGGPARSMSWYPIVAAALVGVGIAALHEAGHTVAGLALGMKLLGLGLGPFQLAPADGKLKLRFSAEGFPLWGGFTSAVPTTAEIPEWKHLFMVAAGPLVNLLSGILALWFAFTAAAGPSVAGGLPVLFGACSVTICVANLIPFRIGDAYSDGATIYQIRSKGPLRDFHRVVLMSGSSTVGPVRPRDFDILVIRRAAREIAQGPHGLLLRLCEYAYYLDREKAPEAGEALREAESICGRLASGIPPELGTTFVFGSAYLWRDASSSRKFWALTVGRSRARPNADYWMAKSAMLWIEGNLRGANNAWERGDALVRRFPAVGACDFQRHYFSMLRKAIEAASMAKQPILPL